MEYLHGIHPVLECLKAGRRRVHEILLTPKAAKRLANLIELATRRKVPVVTTQADRVEQMAQSARHQGVVARVAPYPLVDIDHLIANPPNNPDQGFFLVLDSIVDVGNLGSLMRTALCAGVDGVILPRDRCALPTPAVVKASAGAAEHLPVATVTNLARTLDTLKQNGIWIAGLDMAAPASVFTQDLTCPLALVIGGEEKGIRPLVKSKCDFLVKIPQCGPLNSLNASTAGAVAMYEAYRQRMISKKTT